MKAFLELLKAWGPWGLLVLSTTESAGIPNPGGTDFLLLFLVTTTPSIAWICATLATVGSLVGSTIFYLVMRKGGELYLDKRTASGWGANFRSWFLRYGLVTVFVSALLPFPFMPLKIFVLSAAAMGVPLRRFLLVMALARIPRYFALAYLAKELGEYSSAWLKSHVWHMGVFAALLFAMLYLLIRYQDQRRMEPGA
ncbi:MAG: VTT domain-containing protein [Bryobacteraceae bacterium]